MRKTKVNRAHKPHDFWKIRLAADLITLGSFASLAETQAMPIAAEKTATGNSPAMPGSQALAMPGGQTPGNAAPGGQSSQPDSYTAVNTYTEDTALTGGAFASAGTDENAIVVSAGTTTIDGATITRSSADSFRRRQCQFFTVWARRCW